MIGIIDYGMGNLASVKNACDHLGFESEIISDAKKLETCDKLILPGVGAFKDSMKNIHEKGLYETIVSLVEKGKPLLGICLGMQVLFEAGYEDGYTKGFGFLKGSIQKMEGKDLRIPQIGWNRLEMNQVHPILEQFDHNPYVYYVHSYRAVDYEENDLLAYSIYGDLKVVGLVCHKNVMGAQFHPEKSGEDGLQILRYFGEDFQ